MKDQKVQEFMMLLDNFKNSMIDYQNTDEVSKSLEKVQNFFIVNNKLLEDTEKIEEFVKAYNNFVDFKNRLSEDDFKYNSKEELFEPLNKLVDAINIYIKHNSKDKNMQKEVSIHIADSNVQIGDANTQNINNLTIGELKKRIKESNLEDKEKNDLLGIIDKIFKHPLITSVISGLAGSAI